MKIEFKIIIGILVLDVLMLWLGRPLDDLFASWFNNQTESDLFSDSVIRFFIFGIFLVIAKWLGLARFNGFGRNRAIRNKSVLIVPALFVAAGLKGNWDIYASAEAQLLILFSFSVLATGFVEEISMRGLILPLLIQSQLNRRSSIYFGVIFSSVIFGLIHFLNLIGQPGNYGGITRQVFYAISIGFVLGALMLRTGNIFIPAIFHGFLNFLLGHSVLGERPVEDLPTDIPITENPEWVTWVGTIGIFSIVLLLGWIMIKKVEKEAVYSDLEEVRFR